MSAKFTDALYGEGGGPEQDSDSAPSPDGLIQRGSQGIFIDQGLDRILGPTNGIGTSTSCSTCGGRAATTSLTSLDMTADVGSADGTMQEFLAGTSFALEGGADDEKEEVEPPKLPSANKVLLECGSACVRYQHALSTVKRSVTGSIVRNDLVPDQEEDERALEAAKARILALEAQLQQEACDAFNDGTLTEEVETAQGVLSFDVRSTVEKAFLCPGDDCELTLTCVSVEVTALFDEEDDCQSVADTTLEVGGESFTIASCACDVAFTRSLIFDACCVQK